MQGTIEQVAGGYVLRFERQLKHSVEKVWAALTQPERIADWLAQAEIELVPGGKLMLQFENTGSVILGQVKRVEPPHLFEYIWNSPQAEGSVVRWELHPEGNGCRLVMTHTFPEPAPLLELMAKMAAGWHTHLEGLGQVLQGLRFEWPWSRWEALHAQYLERLAEA
jgi:uncharacterized protein YndB with AHSA1/START domain